jgi:acetyl-CoA carboxylase carboxyl transferase subunit alpha
MLENAWYSVISPEGCASILYRDASKAEEAAQALRITAQDLKGLGIVDEIVEEPLGGAHRDADQTAAGVRAAVKRHLEELKQLSVEDLLERRYRKYRVIGKFQESEKRPAAKGRKKKGEK